MIENVFGRLKQFRGMVIRSDKTPRSLLAAIHFVASVVWLGRR